MTNLSSQFNFQAGMLQQETHKCYEMFIFFRTLIGYIKSCLECKQIEFLRFANKCYLLRLKYLK